MLATTMQRLYYNVGAPKLGADDRQRHCPYIWGIGKRTNVCIS